MQNQSQNPAWPRPADRETDFMLDSPAVRLSDRDDRRAVGYADPPPDVHLSDLEAELSAGRADNRQDSRDRAAASDHPCIREDKNAVLGKKPCNTTPVAEVEGLLPAAETVLDAPMTKANLGVVLLPDATGP